MNKYWLILLVVLAACSDKNKQQSDLDRSNLNGPVLNWIEHTHEAQVQTDELLLGKELTTNFFEYNHKGNVIKSVYTVPAYRYSETTINDEDGNPVSITFKDAEEESSIFVELSLNKDGKISEERWTDEQERLDSRYLNEYEDGKLKLTKVYSKLDELNIIREFHYNADGLVDTAFSYSGERVLQYFIVKSYMAKRMTESKSFAVNKDGESRLNIHIENKYNKEDQHGNWTEKVSVVKNLMSNETTYRVIKREINYKAS
ncbi:MAG: hypothetical protein JXR19_06300 [Bacteroidia bacterium]